MPRYYDVVADIFDSDIAPGSDTGVSGSLGVESDGHGGTVTKYARATKIDAH